MEEFERLKALRAELQARLEIRATEAKTWGKCHDKAEWSRREAHLADVANDKARLKKTNHDIVVEEQRLAAEAPPKQPRVKKVKKPQMRGFRVSTTGEVIHRVSRRLVRLLEGLESPTEETMTFLPEARRFLVYQEEHIAWQRREWEKHEAEAERDG